MGMESYLFKIELHQKIEAQKLNDIFNTLGLQLVEQKMGEHEEPSEFFHELFTDDGIIETHSFLSLGENQLCQFYLRFSICSPPKIVDRTFELLVALNTILPIRVKDMESLNYLHLGPKGRLRPDFDVERSAYIPIDVTIFKQNLYGIAKRALLLEEDREHSVIRGGSATLDHLENKNWLGRFLGWIFN